MNRGIYISLLRTSITPNSGIGKTQQGAKNVFFMGVNFSKRRQPPSAAPRINAVWNEY